jgi:rhodopsin domain-containing protein
LGQAFEILPHRYVAVVFGLASGTHYGNQYLALQPSNLKLWYIYHIIYTAALAAVKFSILVFYSTVFVTRKTRILIFSTMAFISVYSVVMSLLFAFQCKSPSNAWNLAILESGHCVHVVSYLWPSGALNVATDIFVLSIPIPVLWSLRLNQKKRIALIGIFSVSSVAVIASIIRFYAIARYARASFSDISYYSSFLLIWSQVEINTAIICGSIPSLYPLFKLVLETPAETKYTDREYRSHPSEVAGSGVQRNKGMLGNMEMELWDADKAGSAPGERSREELINENKGSIYNC